MYGGTCIFRTRNNFWGEKIMSCARHIISCARLIISCALHTNSCARHIISCARHIISCARHNISCARLYYYFNSPHRCKQDQQKHLNVFVENFHRFCKGKTGYQTPDLHVFSHLYMGYRYPESLSLVISISSIALTYTFILLYTKSSLIFLRS